MTSIDSSRDGSVRFRPRGKQRQRRHSHELAIPGDGKTLRGCDADTDACEAAGSNPDQDQIRPAALEKLVEHGNQALAMAPADDLLSVREAFTRLFEQGGSAGCSRGVDCQNHV